MIPFNFQTLLINQKNNLATVTLNRPELHNAFNEIMIQELTKAFSTLSKDKNTRVIILTGNGESFCAGADLNWMKKMASFTKKENLEDSKRLHKMLETIYRCSKPVIAKVNGSAIGGGVGLVAAADIALAYNTAKFGLSEVRLGLIPAVISPFVIKKIGEANAREYFLTAERFDALKARQMNLVNEVGSPEEIEKKLEEKIKFLLSAGPEALAESKILIEKVSGQPIEKVSAFTSRKIAERRASKEGREGVQAFLEKRNPQWIKAN